MHRREHVQAVLELADDGLAASEIARRTGLPRTTVRDWVAGALPRSFVGASKRCGRCGGLPHAFDDLPTDYVYLLGLYLGDGCISTHPRDVYKLRITLDARHPDVIAACEAAMRRVLPGSKVGTWLRPYRDVEVYSYSKRWPCLFPQHGPGKKHQRTIALSSWQERLVAGRPDLLVRGLLHSDGCRFDNTGRNWRHARYRFVNYSTDIRGIFCSACDLLGIRWTPARDAIYVSRVTDVATLDRIGAAKT